MSTWNPINEQWAVIGSFSSKACRVQRLVKPERPGAAARVIWMEDSSGRPLRFKSWEEARAAADAGNVDMAHWARCSA